MKKNRLQQSAEDKALSEEKYSVRVSIVIGLFVFVCAIFLVVIPIQNSRWSGFAALVSIFIAFQAVVISQTGVRIARLQMQQAKEHRSTDLALANAITELTQELRRRPDVSSSVVTLSLFGPSSLTRPKPESPADKGGM